MLNPNKVGSASLGFLKLVSKHLAYGNSKNGPRVVDGDPGGCPGGVQGGGGLGCDTERVVLVLISFSEVEVMLFLDGWSEGMMVLVMVGFMEREVFMVMVGFMERESLAMVGVMERKV